MMTMRTSPGSRLLTSFYPHKDKKVFIENGVAFISLSTPFWTIVDIWGENDQSDGFFMWVRSLPQSDMDLIARFLSKFGIPIIDLKEWLIKLKSKAVAPISFHQMFGKNLSFYNCTQDSVLVFDAATTKHGTLLPRCTAERHLCILTDLIDYYQQCK